MIMAKTKEEILAKLEALQPSGSGRWRDRAMDEYQNCRWVMYSRIISIRMLDKMRESGISQSELACRMGCSQQYVSKILKGRENLTLETISKIEDAMGFSIMSSPYFVSDADSFHSVAEEPEEYDMRQVR